MPSLLQLITAIEMTIAYFSNSHFHVKKLFQLSNVASYKQKKVYYTHPFVTDVIMMMSKPSKMAAP